ncbi:hypothetical protein B0I08_108103 [Glaciihabitans tibetensis]|uniref:Uncharacterized protein n=1 Tax=Glaciihabitans tibetensis TaxID=1266600 RepID=A0A2T0V9Z7_9MICO|nr:hypothetical protein [Glaciihabitans tibetensis]PRY67019.1 hypothetical protein B0I08_108103 [Glaciihabitans tibetensis]
MTPAGRLKAEKLAGAAFWCAGIVLVAVTLLPVLVIMAIGLVTGTTPSEDEGGIYGVASGYPAFDPQAWLIWIPAIVLLAFSLFTIPLPMRGMSGRGSAGLSRPVLTYVTLALFLMAFVNGGAFVGAPGIGPAGLYASLVVGLTFVLLLLRTIAGALRLVPKSWREGTPVQPRSPGEKDINVA